MTGGRTSIYWWAFPSRVALLVTAPIFIGCWSLGDIAYDFYGHNHKYLTGDVALAGMLAILAFAIAAILTERGVFRQSLRTPVSREALDKAIIAVGALVILAYGIFFFPLLFRPHLIVYHLMGNPDAMDILRETLNRIPGLTSLVSLQSVLAVLIVAYTAMTGRERPRHFTYLLFLVAFLCLMRTWLWSERLATIELAIPIIILKLARFDYDPRRKVRFLMFAPILGVAALFLLFMAGEYFRSWQYYQHVFAGSFPEFIATRLAGYYATSLNNGAALLTLHDPFYAPSNTLKWLYKFPLWSLIDPSWLKGSFDEAPMLQAYLNPEFNNMSGIFQPLSDFGTPAGILIWAALGALTGALFSSFATGGVTGLILYPLWFTGIVEMLRVFYWGETRFFPALIGALIVAHYLKQKATSVESAASPAPA